MGINKIRLLSTKVFWIYNLLSNLEVEEKINRKSEVVIGQRMRVIAIFTGYT